MKGKSHSNVTFVIIAFIKVWHIETVHEEYKSFKCKICDYKCSGKNTLDPHVATVHEEKK